MIERLDKDAADNDENNELLIIGGGQAGLAAGYYAKQLGLRFQILDEQGHVGESWRRRYDSLKLFTPKEYSSLPGLEFSGDPHECPSKDEVADYLKKYADEFELPVNFNQHVKSVTSVAGNFKVETEGSEYLAQSVIVATGPFQKPRIPEWAKEIASSKQIHSSEYRNPEQIQGNKVLVVGGGNSGAQIAEELAGLSFDVSLSVNSRMRFIPEMILGKSVFWWLDVTGVLEAPTKSRRATLLRKRGDPIIGGNLKDLIQDGKVTLESGATQTQDGAIIFNDGTSNTYDTIIWSTGFTMDYSYMKISDALGIDGSPIQEEGISTTVKHLGYVGLGWMRSRNSALLGGVGKDAEHVVNRVIK